MNVDPWLGKTLGARYRLEHVLGRGGMSAVYKAVDPNLRRTVAIKLIHAHLSDQAEFLRRFEEEAAAVAQLRHPNIVQVYDFNHDGGVYYMVLEHITGETLQQRLKRVNDAGQRLPLADALRYAAGVCDAVDYAHRQGMIHRDIKPANIMLNDNDQAILMDFGIAKIVGGQQHTATGAVVGTALYMAPEQIRSQPADHRSDVYSLGVTIFEMLSGRPPFESDSAMTLMMMHLSQPAPDLRDLRPDTPDGVAEVLRRALEKEPVQRFESASEMGAALRRELVRLHGLSTANAARPAPGFEPTLRQSPITPGELAAEAALMRASAAGTASGGAGMTGQPGSGVAANSGGFAVPPNRNTPPGGMTGFGVRPGVTGSHPVPKQRRVMVAGGCALALVLLMCGLGTGGLFIGRNAMANQSNAIAMQTIFAATQTIIQETRSAIEFAFTQAAQPALEATPTANAAGTQTAVAELTQAAQANAGGEISATATPNLLLAIAQETPRPTAAISVVIVGIHIDGEDIVVDYETVGFIESSSNRHIHFFFNNTPLDANGQPESGALVMYSGPRPFHGLTIWDVPSEATQLCAIVATRDHEAMPDSGTCVDIPEFVTPTSAPATTPKEPKDNDKPGPEY